MQLEKLRLGEIDKQPAQGNWVCERQSQDLNAGPKAHVLIVASLLLAHVEGSPRLTGEQRVMGSQQVCSDMRWGERLFSLEGRGREDEGGWGGGLCHHQVHVGNPSNAPYPQVYISTEAPLGFWMGVGELIPMSLHPVKEEQCLPC